MLTVSTIKIERLFKSGEWSVVIGVRPAGAYSDVALILSPKASANIVHNLVAYAGDEISLELPDDEGELHVAQIAVAADMPGDGK